MATRVLIADDQDLVRAGLRMILDAEDTIDVVAEATNGREAVEQARLFNPDVVLMDIRMPELDGLAATRELVAAGTRTRILALTTFDLDEYVFDALRAGAGGFLLKEATGEDLVEAVRLLARGEALLAPAVTRRVIELFADMPAPRDDAALADLSPRELEVLRLLAQGRSNAQIAGELVVSAATVKTHVSNVLAKLRLPDRVQAVIFAYETGLVRPGAA